MDGQGSHEPPHQPEISRIDEELGEASQTNTSVTACDDQQMTFDASSGDGDRRGPSKVRAKIRASIHAAEDITPNSSDRGVASSTSPRTNISNRSGDNRNKTESKISAAPRQPYSSSSGSNTNSAKLSAGLRREKWEAGYRRNVGRADARQEGTAITDNDKDEEEHRAAEGTTSNKAGIIMQGASTVQPGAVAVNEPPGEAYTGGEGSTTARPSRRRPTPTAPPISPQSYLDHQDNHDDDDEMPVVVHATAVVVTDDEDPPKRHRNPFRDRRVLICILIGVAAIVGLVVALVVALGANDSGGGGGDNSSGGVAENSSNQGSSSSTNTPTFSSTTNPTTPSSTPLPTPPPPPTPPSASNPSSSSPTPSPSSPTPSLSTSSTASPTLLPTANVVGTLPTLTSIPTSPPARTSLTLSTPFDGTFTRTAMVFDLTAKSNVYLTGLSLLIDSSAFSEISLLLWTKQGTYVGFDTNENAWTPLHNTNGSPIRISRDETTTIMTNNGDSIVRIPEDMWGQPLRMGENARRAFYIHLIEPSNGLLNTGTGTNVGSVRVQDENLAVLVGASKGTQPFGSATNQRRGWNGVVHYEV